VIPRRWAVERTFVWLTAHRRLARDYERDPAISEAMIRWAAISTITRRIARGDPPPGSSDAPSPPVVDLLKHALPKLCHSVTAPAVPRAQYQRLPVPTAAQVCRTYLLTGRLLVH
jgi:hypothetical protein